MQSGPSNAKTGKAGAVSKKKKVRHWDKKSSKVALNLSQSHDEIDTSPVESPLVYFERVFPRSLVEHIVGQTNQYSQQHGRDVSVLSEEILGIIGFMIYSGYKPVHYKQLMWRGDEDVSLQWAEDLMPVKGSKLFYEIFIWLTIAL